MTDDLKPFTRSDLNIYIAERDREIEQRRRDTTVRLVYNSAIEKMKSVTNEKCYTVYAHIYDVAFRSGDIENRLRNLFPDFVVSVTTEIYGCHAGFERQRITVKW